ncbi:alpha-glucuronidase family glycosyl hydrolase [Rhodanobacter sp. DHB23]|uniref:alpha-glucuronidase family glycosyl hydrolase n=1 Tax=Rhodanobacter sp. DHB23 TaxID=2775923 RepID=UPI00177D4C2E|nr:alpha-glucuronidase family glycosyl hydrolase [Rhodanobacter sp. DHB23]MBD8871335.1 alpha-glucuronidase [Rhodanobacter sp. DHB23]
MTTPRSRALLARLLTLLLSALAAVGARTARAEDGYELWLRYHPLPAAQAAAYRAHVVELAMSAGTPAAQATRDELLRGLGGLLGAAPRIGSQADQDGALLVGTPDSSPQLARLGLDTRALGREGYLISSVKVDGHAAIAIVGNSDVGVLYGAFRFLRLLQTAQPLDHLDIRDAPRVQLRMLDHWDNLDGSVERGYAGASIWDWWKLPGYVDPRITDYARANASIGINGAVLNNVNADKLSLTTPYLAKAAAIADVLRPYGIRVYLSVRFSSPIELGGLKTADPLDPAVAAWWRAKVDAIYKLIPDFGGFLVKANSEGQPGPQDYGRSHADGANMLAAVLAPHGGVVMWRAFVYSNKQPDDRARQAYDEFKPLDGRFRSNVILQVKNGPIDFQPREPFHPLFGAMPDTALMMEFQVTKEYLGFATHLVYLGTLFQETLQSDTMARGKGSTVARVIDGSLYAGTAHAHRLTAMAGVANIGSDRDWCGSTFNQANWYAFGRLAWNPDDSARAIAADWVRMTFGNDPAIVAPIVGMMMGSREAAVDYMTPLGLHHQMHEGDHYGPAPWDASEPRADWRPAYYNRADKDGIGFDRSSHGSDAVAQYAPPVAAGFDDLARIPDRYLLWFHHLPWDYRMRSGRTLWDELVLHYSHGVDAVAAMRVTWRSLAGHIDTERYAKTSAFLAIQQREAQWWRDASIAYFQSLNGLPLPAGIAPPAHPLKYYQSLSFPFAPGYNSW